MSKRAAVYARQSLDRTGEGLAISRQLEDCRDLLSRNGWTAAGEYVDNDVSATSGKVRPEYRRLLADAEQGRLDVVVAWSADRLTRRPIEVEHLIDVLERSKIGLATVSGEVDLSTPYGRAIARIFGAIARQEVEQKGARQARANEQRAQNGESPWSRRPFGYDRRNGKIVVVPAERKVILAAAKKVMEGATLASIIRDMNRRGVVTSTGSAWTVTALRRVLTSPRHVGLVVYKGAEIGAGDWPAIFTRDQHRELVEKLRDPRRRTQQGTAIKYLLGGLARCGVCDATLIATAWQGRGAVRRMIYRCPARHVTRKMTDVDEVVEAVMVARLSRPDAVAVLTPSVDIRQLRTKADDLATRRDDLAQLLADGLLSATAVRQQTTRIRDDLQELEAQIAAAIGDNPAAGIAGSVDVQGAWDGADVRTKRAIIRSLLAVSVLPMGKGRSFEPESLRLEWLS